MTHQVSHGNNYIVIGEILPMVEKKISKTLVFSNKEKGTRHLRTRACFVIIVSFCQQRIQVVSDAGTHALNITSLLT